jgi:predicted DNA binding CopG/RHH family protein
MINISKIKLSKEERAIEKALLAGEYRSVSKKEFKAMAQAIARRRKEAILHIRINQQDLDILKKRAARFGVPYQTLISEILHRFAA